jgi:hypothetical protein
VTINPKLALRVVALEGPVLGEFTLTVAINPISTERPLGCRPTILILFCSLPRLIQSPHEQQRELPLGVFDQQSLDVLGRYFARHRQARADTGWKPDADVDVGERLTGLTQHRKRGVALVDLGSQSGELRGRGNGRLGLRGFRVQLISERSAAADKKFAALSSVGSV